MRSIPPGAQTEQPTARPGTSPWTKWAITYLALSVMEVQPPLLLFLLALGKVQQVGNVDLLGALALVLAAFALFAAAHAIASASTYSRMMWRLGQPLFGIVAVGITALLAWSAPPAITLIDIPPALLDATIIIWLGLRVRSFMRYQQAGVEAAQEWVMQTFRIGLIVFAAALVLAIIFDVPQVLSGIVLLPAYLLGGIVASAVLRSVALQQIATQDDQPPEQHPWTLLAGGIGVICALAFFGGGLLGTQPFAGAVTPVFQALETGAQWLGNGIAWLFASLSSLFDHLFSAGSTSTSNTTSTSIPPPQNNSAIGGFPSWLVALSALLWVVFIGWLIRSWWMSRRRATVRRQIRIPRALVIVLFIILLLILLAPLLLSLTATTSTAKTSTTTTAQHPATTPHIPLLFVLLAIVGIVILAFLGAQAWRSLQNQEADAPRYRFNLFAELRRLLSGLRWRRSRSRAAFEQRYPVTGEQGDTSPLPAEAAAPLNADDDDTIRATYRRMLATTARAGGAWARQPDETPTEYARRLHTLMATQPDGPAQTEEADVTLDTLTDAYRQARYGGQPPDTTTRTTIAGRLSRLLALFRSK